MDWASGCGLLPTEYSPDLPDCKMSSKEMEKRLQENCEFLCQKQNELMERLTRMNKELDDAEGGGDGLDKS